MEELKKLLKVVEESRKKREEECDKIQEKYGFMLSNITKEEALELGRMQGRIYEKKDIAAAIKRMIKRKEEQKTDVKFEQALKEIEEVMSILPFLAIFLEKEV